MIFFFLLNFDTLCFRCNDFFMRFFSLVSCFIYFTEESFFSNFINHKKPSKVLYLKTIIKDFVRNYIFKGMPQIRQYFATLLDFFWRKIVFCLFSSWEDDFLHWFELDFCQDFTKLRIVVINHLVHTVWIFVYDIIRDIYDLLSVLSEDDHRAFFQISSFFYSERPHLCS